MRVISAGELRAVASVPKVAERTRTIFLLFAGVTVRVRTSVFELAAELERKYTQHLTGAEKSALCFTVSQTPAGYAFGSAAGNWEWPYGPLPPDALAFLADAALLSAVIRSDTRLCSMHAAAIEIGGTGAAIVGNSTAGKTTTLLAWAREGLRVYSDERALLRDGTLQPFLRACTVRDGGRRLLLRDAAHDALGAALFRREPIDLTECFGESAIARPAPLRALFVLEDCAAEPQVRSIASSQALAGLARWFDARGTAIERLGRAVMLLRGLPCYGLRLGIPSASARAIRHVLEAQ